MITTAGVGRTGIASGDFLGDATQRIAALQKQLQRLGEKFVDEAKSATYRNPKAELEYMRSLQCQITELLAEIAALQRSMAQKRASEEARAEHDARDTRREWPGTTSTMGTVINTRA